MTPKSDPELTFTKHTHTVTGHCDTVTGHTHAHGSFTDTLSLDSYIYTHTHMLCHRTQTHTYAHRAYICIYTQDVHTYTHSCPHITQNK